MNVRGLRSIVSLSLCLWAGLLVFSGASASAHLAHPYLCQITGSEIPSTSECNLVGNMVPGGGLGRPQGVAVDSSGQIYVSDSSTKAVDVFDSAGNFERQIAGASPSEQFNDPWGLALDGANNLWVADVGHGLVDKFDGVGNLLAQATGEGHWTGQYTRGLAFSDSTNLLYVADSNNDDLWVLNADGSFHGDITGPWGSNCCFIYPAADNSAGPARGDIYVISSGRGLFRIDGSGAPAPFSGSAPYISGAHLTGTPAGAFGELTAVTVDPAGNLYVFDSGSGSVDEFNSAGVFMSATSRLSTPSGSFGNAGIAADGSGDLYVTAQGSPSAIDVFGPLADLPTVAIEPPTSLQESAATLAGAVNPENSGTVTCQFEWGTTIAYGHVAACPSSIPNGESPVSVQAQLTGLEVDTTYHYRLIATTANGTEGSRDETFTTPGAPAIEAESSEVASNEKRGQTNATLQAQIDPNRSETTYHFEYGETPGYGTDIPAAPASIGAGGQPVSVPAAELSGLKLDTTYHYRVVASNQYGTVEGPDQTFTTLPPLLLDEESVSDVTSSSVTLRGELNPLGSDTRYRFEYGPTASYGARAPDPDGDLGAGENDETVSQHLQDLQANTLYHYRLVAENATGTVAGPDRTFTTQIVGGGQALTDDRRWEMVSPPEKNGADLPGISEQAGEERAAPDGNAFTYAAFTPVEAEPDGFAGKVQEFSVRGANGWTQVKITVAHAAATSTSLGYGPEYRSFSEDLSLAAVQPFGPFDQALSAEASEQTALLRRTYLNGNVEEPCASSCYQPLVTGTLGFANVLPGTVFGGGQTPGTSGYECYTGCGPQFIGATPDMSHVVLSSLAPLTASSSVSNGLYEWSAGRLTFIGKGAVGAPENEAVEHAISNDGARVIVDGEVDGVQGLFSRDTATGEPVKLDAVQGGSGEGNAEPIFQAASDDGSRVFFTDTQGLTKDASSAGSDLYECELVREAGALKCKLSDLTPASAGESAQVQGALVGVSEDGSWVYFVANGRLGTDASRGACEPSAPPRGECNLFVLHLSGGTWERPKLIARLSAGDANDWDPRTSRRPTRVSPDGRWLAFMAQDSLTGYDNRDAVNGRPDAEVYLYDADAGRLLCASCDPTGARPVGRKYSTLEPGSGGLSGGPRGVWGPDAWVAAAVPGWQQSDPHGDVETYQSRYLFDDGRLFFNSDDALVPQDVNGEEDVYEYEPPGIGSCATASTTYSERSGGCVGLISSGTSPREAGFLDASEGGGDVFFITSEKLVAQDFDTSLDIYDAHECTVQAPCATGATAPPPCSTGDACKPSPTPQPSIYGAPASATFSGAGNVASGSHGASAPRSLSRAQKLSKALKACRRKAHRRRLACERKARKRYAIGSTRKTSRSRKAIKTNRKQG
jgi:DNA-binding beta-propeller fold protein YncE